ncbi:MAG: hypothetical protein ACP5N2_04340 [Candidatus Nanoarchaeia archaeon]
MKKNKVDYGEKCYEFMVDGAYHIGKGGNFLYFGNVTQFPISSNLFNTSAVSQTNNDGLVDIVGENDVLGINSFINECTFYEEELRGYSQRRMVSFSRILKNGQGKKLLNILDGFTPCGFCNNDKYGMNGMTSEPVGGNPEDMYTITKEDLSN